MDRYAKIKKMDLSAVEDWENMANWRKQSRPKSSNNYANTEDMKIHPFGIDPWSQGLAGDCSMIKRQLEEVKNILNTMKEREEHRDMEAFQLRVISKEWKMVALCLDRLFFLIYLITIILSLFFLFPRPPA